MKEVMVENDKYITVSKKDAQALWERGAELCFAAAWEQVANPVFGSVKKMRQSLKHRDFNAVVSDLEKNDSFCFPDVGTFVKVYAKSQDLKEMRSDRKLGKMKEIEASRAEGKEKLNGISFVVLGKEIAPNEYEAMFFGKDGLKVPVLATKEEKKKAEEEYQAALKSGGRIRPKLRSVTEHVKIENNRILAGYPYTAWDRQATGYMDVTDSVRVNWRFGRPGTILFLRPNAMKGLNMDLYRVEMVDLFKGHVKDCLGEHGKIYQIDKILSKIQGVAVKRTPTIDSKGRLCHEYRDETMKKDDVSTAQEVFDRNEASMMLDYFRFRMDFQSLEKLKHTTADVEKEFSDYGIRSAKVMLKRRMENFMAIDSEKIMEKFKKVMFIEQFRVKMIEVDAPRKGKTAER